MKRKKSPRKIEQRQSNAAKRRIEEFHKREEERKKIQSNPILGFNYEIVELPQPLASMVVLGLTKILKFQNSGDYKYREKVLVFAEKSSNESNLRLRNDEALYTIYVNAKHMGYLGKTHELPVKSYIGYIEVGEKTKDGNYIILDSFYFFNKTSIKPDFLSKCKPLKATIKYIRLEENVIKVPLSDDLWHSLENQKELRYPRHNSVFFYWKPIFNSFHSYKYGFGNEDGLYDVVFSNRGKKKCYSQNNRDAITKELSKEPGLNTVDVMVFHFDRMNLEQDCEESAFEILKKKDWILDWNCVLFKNGYFTVYPPIDRSVSFNPINVSCPGVLESFNYLKGYFNDRLSSIRCLVEKMTLFITDRIILDEAITKFATASMQRAITTTGSKSVSRTVLNQVSFNQVLSKAQQLTEEEFKKYKSKYIDYLTNNQYEKYKIIPCVERLAHKTGDMTEYAFMFSLKCKQDRVLIVHENVNPDRSTLLFIIEENNYEKTIRAIYDFLQGAEINKRSGIRNEAIQISGTGVINYKSINHNDFNSWQNEIEDYINKAVYFKKMERNLLKARFSSLSRLLREVQKKENFEKAKPIFEMLNLPLNGKVTPAFIVARVPASHFYIDSEGKKLLAIPNRGKRNEVNFKGDKVEVRNQYGNPVYEYKLSPIQKNCWSLEILIELLAE